MTKGEPESSPHCWCGASATMSRHCLPARRTLDLAGVETSRADLHLLDLAVDDGANHLEVRLPCAAGLVVRVRDVVAERNALVAHVAAVSLDAHGSALDQLDARHLGAVTFAVTGFENACVPTRATRELRSQLLEELVRGFTLVDVTRGKAACVQRTGARLGDQLFDERTQLLRLGLGRLDRAMLDERRREIAHERELLLSGPAKLPPGFAMPHVLTPPCRRARRRRPGSAVCPNRARARCRRHLPRNASRNSDLRARGDRRSPGETSGRNS